MGGSSTKENVKQDTDDINVTTTEESEQNLANENVLDEDDWTVCDCESDKHKDEANAEDNRCEKEDHPHEEYCCHCKSANGGPMDSKMQVGERDPEAQRKTTNESYQRSCNETGLGNLTELSDGEQVSPECDEGQDQKHSYEGQEWYNYKEILITQGKEKAYEFVMKICGDIKTEDDSIVHVSPSYKNTNREKPVLVAMTTNKSSYFGWYKGFEVVYRNVEENAYDESKTLTKLSKKFSEKDQKRLSDSINEYGDELMEQHSNLVIISASSFKSQGYGTADERLLHKTCIVLHCICKGYIPFLEEPFPKFIGGIDVDVREGMFELAVGERPPTEYQPELRSGAAVGAIGKRSMGSIGPIFDHPRDGYVGFGTCAHVFLTDEEILAFGAPKLELYTSFKTVLVEQPPGSGFDCGSIVKTVIREGGNGTAGVDACIVRVTDRWPNCGYFPLHEEHKLQVAGFSITSPPHYNGKIEFDADKWRNQDLLKYGCVTKLTRGVLHLQSVFVRRCIFNAEHGRCSFKLSGQFEIVPVSLDEQTQELFPFAERGDSGSLVYSRSENDELRAIGVISGVTNYGTTIVTPIRDYLEALDIGELKTFKQFQLNPNMNNLASEFSAMSVRRVTGMSSSQDSSRNDNVHNNALFGTEGLLESLFGQEDKEKHQFPSLPLLSGDGKRFSLSRVNDDTKLFGDSFDTAEFINRPDLLKNKDVNESSSGMPLRDEIRCCPPIRCLQETTCENRVMFQPNNIDEDTPIKNEENVVKSQWVQMLGFPKLNDNDHDETKILTETLHQTDIANGTGSQLEQNEPILNLNTTAKDNTGHISRGDLQTRENIDQINGNSQTTHDHHHKSIKISFDYIKEITTETMNKSCHMAINQKASNDVKKTLITENSSLGKAAVKEIGNITVASMTVNADTDSEVKIICPNCGTRNYFKRESGSDIEEGKHMSCPNCNHRLPVKGKRKETKI